MSARVAPDRMTVGTYLDWAESQPRGRYELVDGVPLRMSPERNLHALVKAAVYLAFADAVRAYGRALVAFVDGPTVATGHRRAREPDIVVHPREGIDWQSPLLDRPVVLVEVTSPSTARTDNVDKLVEYFSVSSVLHYLIVDPDAWTVVHHRRNEGGVVESVTAAQGMLSLEPPGLLIDTARFFADLHPLGAN